MRLLVVHPGADYSVADVNAGYVEAFARLGHSVGVYALNGHLEMAAKYLAQQLARLRRTDPTLPGKPSLPEIMIKASEHVLITALRGRADAVIVIASPYLHPSALYLLRAARMPVGIIFTESPYLDDDQANYAGLVSVCWTNDRGSVDRLRAVNPRTWYLPAAYRAGVHCPGEPAPGTPAHDVVFVGTLFPERAELLAAVDWTGVDLGLYGNADAVDRRSAAYRKLKPFWRGGVVENEQAIDLYRAAKIALNPYRTIEFIGSERHMPGESVNPRGYELAACGAFQLSSFRPEVPDVFGGSVPTFADADELGRLVRFYLGHDEWRAAAAAGARAAVEPHSFDARARQVTEQLEGALLHNPFAVPAPASSRGKVSMVAD